MKWVTREEVVGRPNDDFPERDDWWTVDKEHEENYQNVADGCLSGGVYRVGKLWYIISRYHGYGHYTPMPEIKSLEEAKAFVEAVIRMS